MNHSQIHPSREQLEALKKLDPNQAVVMINLIRFRDKVEGGIESGKSAYYRYMKNMVQLVEGVQGKVIWQGKPLATVIGDSDQQPDLIFHVEYPSIKNFFAMISHPDYKEISKDRTMALEYGGLIACASF